MTRKRTNRRGPGRLPVHDPTTIRALLSEREQTGETYVALEGRSGIPASTLGAWSRRQAKKASKRPSFVEVVVTEEAEQSESGRSFEIIAGSPSGPRRVLVPADFDASALQRLLDCLEQRC